MKWLEILILLGLGGLYLEWMKGYHIIGSIKEFIMNKIPSFNQKQVAQITQNANITNTTQISEQSILGMVRPRLELPTTLPLSVTQTVQTYNPPHVANPPLPGAIHPFMRNMAGIGLGGNSYLRI